MKAPSTLSILLKLDTISIEIDNNIVNILNIPKQ